jgi:hypothetical protein
MSINQKCCENFEMLCWGKMEKIVWMEHVKNEEVLRRVEEKRNVLCAIERRKLNGLVTLIRTVI